MKDTEAIAAEAVAFCEAVSQGQAYKILYVKMKLVRNFYCSIAQSLKVHTLIRCECKGAIETYLPISTLNACLI